MPDKYFDTAILSVIAGATEKDGAVSVLSYLIDVPAVKPESVCSIVYILYPSELCVIFA